MDNGTPRAAVNLLRKAGHAATHVGEIGMAAASDIEIIGRALTDAFVIVTLDSDFHELLAASHSTELSVIRIGVEGLKGDALVLVVLKVIDDLANEIAEGAAVSDYRTSMCYRLLPL